ncbi:lipocalin family protein [Polaribacter sp. SA4-12]|uniref:lipocalin family protein n=1 Tax=Polaribacter sp. SA4-12 TaxID=1312072 RepID=UPI000B3D20AE|nr:lipocalin family protein [Polaribacter sp. SA4-12]ARV15362.1 hypothetical protein BTO07_09510 [Polaribacter sp. SA4-12]
MKKVKLFSLVLLSIITFSCSSNDEDVFSNIEGTWKPVKQADTCPNGDNDIGESGTCELLNRITFESEGIFTETAYERYKGNCEFDYTKNSTWDISNDKLIINGFGTFDYYEISGNVLKIGNKDNSFCEGGLSYTEYTRVN